MRHLLLATAVTIATSIAISAQQPPQQPQVPRPSFETKAEIVLVDVNVIDRDAKPVPSLTTSDFELEVNGQPREIHTVQFISTVPENTSAATPRETAYTSNESATTGRLLLFVVDEGSLRVGSNRAILRSAQSLFDRLAPGDLVGVARLPTASAASSSPPTQACHRCVDARHRLGEHARRHDEDQHQRSVGAQSNDPARSRTR